LLYGAALLENWKLTVLSLLYEQQNIGAEILGILLRSFLYQKLLLV